jgi:F-box-like
MESIPNELLEMILETVLLDRSSWLPVPLVCKRWYLPQQCGKLTYSRCCKHAAKTGNVEMLQWIASNGGIVPNKCLVVAVKNGQHQTVEWLLDHGLTWDPDVTGVAGRIVSKGLLSCLNCLYQRGLKINELHEDTRHLVTVVSHNQFGVIEWFTQNWEMFSAQWLKNPEEARVFVARLFLKKMCDVEDQEWRSRSIDRIVVVEMLSGIGRSEERFQQFEVV